MRGNNIRVKLPEGHFFKISLLIFGKMFTKYNYYENSAIAIFYSRDLMQNDWIAEFKYSCDIRNLQYR